MHGPKEAIKLLRQRLASAFRLWVIAHGIWIIVLSGRPKARQALSAAHPLYASTLAW
jgi:hypothetical protein